VDVTWETTQGLLKNEWIYIREESWAQGHLETGIWGKREGYRYVCHRLLWRIHGLKPGTPEGYVNRMSGTSIMEGK
jgi:hypothetical protein